MQVDEPNTGPLTVAHSKIPHKTPWDFTAEINSLLLTPITFYGKVVDQHSKPIANATVLTIAADTLVGHGTDRIRSTDANGLFPLSGAHGSNLVIEVSKEGFHQLTNLQSMQYNMPPSMKGFTYALGGSDGVHKPDKANPQIFMLYRPGVLEPLLTRPEVRWRLKEGGGSTVVSLHPDESPQHSVKIDLSFEKGITWWPQNPYDWRLEVSAVDGVVLHHTDLFPFEAPADGYEPSSITNFSKSMPENQWKYKTEKSYYIRFNDNTYARIFIECYARERPLIILKSWLNPKLGSRNLEPTGSNK
jgi:hypothetical protein